MTTMIAASAPLALCYDVEDAQPPTKKRQSGISSLDTSVLSAGYYTAAEEEEVGDNSTTTKFLIPIDTWKLVMRFLLGFHTGNDNNYVQRKALHDELLSPIGFTFEPVRPSNMVTDLPRRCMRIDQCVHCLRSSFWVFAEFYEQESEYVDFENDSFYVTCGETRWMRLEGGHQCNGLDTLSGDFSSF
jgi:hypothetical protein